MKIRTRRQWNLKQESNGENMKPKAFFFLKSSNIDKPLVWQTKEKKWENTNF